MNLAEEKQMARFFPGWTTWKKDWDAWRVASRRPDGNTVIFIPARSGSTRIPDKNVAPLCGKPLIAYTITVAKALRGVDRVVVSTDSPRYAKIALDLGVDQAVIRPTEISGAKARYRDAYRHMLFSLAVEGYQATTIVSLVPTNPFRNAARIQKMLDTTKRYGVCTSVFRPQSFHSAGQDQVPFKPMGLFSGRNVSNVNVNRSIYWFIANPFELIDIDTSLDLDLARYVLENQLFDFGLRQ